jgi:hypothetical protein
MKLTLTLCFFFVISAKVIAAPSPILVCLAQEELALHKSKNHGPVYNLNQTLVNQIAMIPKLIVSQENINRICHNKKYGPSLSLLRLILINDGNIFTIKKDSAGHGLAVGQLGSFIESAPHIMFDYLNEIQALMPYAQCLKDEIPEVQYFYDRYKYLEEDLSGNQLIQNKDKLNAIFKKLNQLEEVIDNCRKKAEQLKNQINKKI